MNPYSNLLKTKLFNLKNNIVFYIKPDIDTNDFHKKAWPPIGGK
jgi:hypothetical protein